MADAFFDLDLIEDILIFKEEQALFSDNEAHQGQEIFREAPARAISPLRDDRTYDGCPMQSGENWKGTDKSQNFSSLTTSIHFKHWLAYLLVRFNPDAYCQTQ